MTKYNSDLFFCCSLIEWIGRACKQERGDVVHLLGLEAITRIYQNADILHCEPIEKTANVYIDLFHIPQGHFDNITSCIYDVPDYWAIGAVYARLIEDTAKESVVQGLLDIYASPTSDYISNYNSDFYYQPREYISACHQAGEIL